MTSPIKSVLFFFFYIIIFLPSNLCLGSHLVQKEDDLFYTTLHIKTNKGTGTGFIYNFNDLPYLVTNKHVVYQEEIVEGYLKFHTTTSNFFECKIGNSTKPFYKHFIFHEGELDLCYLPLQTIIEVINNQLSQNPGSPLSNVLFSEPPVTVIYYALDSSHLADFNDINLIQDILVIGYPKGLFDETNNLPILRKGVTSSHLRKDFQGRPEFLIDAPCYPGFAGSPVFIFPQKESQQDLNQSLRGSGDLCPKLLGILWGGVVYNSSGEIMCEDNKMAYGPIPINISTEAISAGHLGIVIKSTELTHWNN